MAYCTASDVRQIIHTSLSDTDIASIIETSDAVIDRRIGAQSTSDKAVKKLSMLITARSIKARQPRSAAAGEYREGSTAPPPSRRPSTSTSTRTRDTRRADCDGALE